MTRLQFTHKITEDIEKEYMSHQNSKPIQQQKFFKNILWAQFMQQKKIR